MVLFLEPSALVSLLLGATLLLFLYPFYYATSLRFATVEGVKVPKGNFWLLPVLGDTISFLRTPPKVFYYQHTEKYGDTFTTHLGGTPTIVTSNLELTKWVYQQGNKCFSVTFPKSATDVLGKESVMLVRGTQHTRLRRLMAGPLSTEKLVGFTGTVDRLARQTMDSWRTRDTIVILDEAKKYVLSLGWAHLITIDTQDYPYLEKMLADVPGTTQIDKLVQLCYTMERGMLTIPLYIPGTRYFKAMKARGKFENMLTKMIADRRSGKVKCEDLLQAMTSSDDGSMLTDAQIIDNIFSTLGASEATSSVCIVWMIKWIHENPDLLRDLKAEHDAIAKSKESKDEGLTYQDTKKMNLTLWTMYETLRLVAVTGPFTGRSADIDIRIKDIVIPKDWRVMMTHGYHLDPQYFPDPESFNPYRFQVAPAPNSFTPFGHGIRMCPGRELAKLEILVFVHRILTTYSWEAAEPDAATVWYPTPYPSNKLPIKVTPLQPAK